MPARQARAHRGGERVVVAGGELVGSEGQEEHADGELVAVGDGPVDGGDDRADVGGATASPATFTLTTWAPGATPTCVAGGDAGEVRAVTGVVTSLVERGGVGGEVGTDDEAVARTRPGR